MIKDAKSMIDAIIRYVHEYNGRFGELDQLNCIFMGSEQREAMNRYAKEHSPAAEDFYEEESGLPDQLNGMVVRYVSEENHLSIGVTLDSLNKELWYK